MYEELLKVILKMQKQSRGGGSGKGGVRGSGCMFTKN